ncbi:class I SAM-dependent methyltransferase [Salinisphaera hydrothermalis]|uniref:class I SAM-dependent methyltransferase n=1 Tax=Salinisphaera hydrothermalis TaxID=563188 RepID=UPI0033428B62
MATIHSLNDLIVFTNSQGTAARGNLVKVSRTTLIFEVYNPYSIVQLSEVLHSLEIRGNDRVIYRGRAVVSGLVNTGLMLIVSASLLDPWSELIGLAGDRENIRHEIHQFIDEWQSNQQIRPDYQLSVSRLRSFLTALNRWLEHLDFEDDRGDTAASRDQLFPDLAEPLVPPLIELFSDFEKQASQIPEEERITHMRYAQDDLHPLLMRAPFVHRAYYKPLGYAGDYEMVNMMLRDPREGPTIYAQLINTLYLQTGPAEAHRNRINILVDQLRDQITRLRKEAPDKTPRILNVGCGPAIELQRLIRQSRAIEICDITLIDFSRETLDYTEKQLNEASDASGIRPQITFSHQSVHGLLRHASRPEGSEQDEYDIIYCAGLFDYLSDRVCARLLNLFHQWCKEGGQVMVTNVHPDNPARHWMEHLLEWYLIYRDDTDMEKLGAPFPNHQVFKDETGINIFLHITKDSNAGQ